MHDVKMHVILQAKFSEELLVEPLADGNNLVRKNTVAQHRICMQLEQQLAQCRSTFILNRNGSLMIRSSPK